MSRNKAEKDEAQKETATRPGRQKASPCMHPAGPHARPELTDQDATPGTGALPDITADKDIDPGSD